MTEGEKAQVTLLFLCFLLWLVWMPIKYSLRICVIYTSYEGFLSSLQSAVLAKEDLSGAPRHQTM